MARGLHPSTLHAFFAPTLKWQLRQLVLFDLLVCRLRRGRHLHGRSRPSLHIFLHVDFCVVYCRLDAVLQCVHANPAEELASIVPRAFLEPGAPMHASHPTSCSDLPPLSLRGTARSCGPSFGSRCRWRHTCVSRSDLASWECPHDDLAATHSLPRLSLKNKSTTSPSLFWTPKTYVTPFECSTLGEAFGRRTVLRVASVRRVEHEVISE